MNKKDLFLTDNGHYWVRSKHDKKVYLVQYQKEPEGFFHIGSPHLMHIDNYEVVSDIILRETEKV